MSEVTPKMNRPIPSVDLLNEWLNYEPETGLITWRKSPSHSTPVGLVAGTVDGRGYLQIGVRGIKYLAHRLAWMMVHGECPRVLDHINGDPLDNRIVNLRPASLATNQFNKRLARNNTSGFKGVHPTRGGGFRASIKTGRKTLHIGTFVTAEDAHAAYCAEAQKLFGEFANGGTGPINIQASK